MAQMPTTIDYSSNWQPGNYGLLANVSGPLEMPAHATFAGLEFVSDLCGEGHLYPGICDTTPPGKEWDTCDEPGGCGLTSALPFWTYVTEVCAPVGRGMAEVERRIRRKLDLRRSWLVERAFWGDDASAPGYLQQLGATPIGAEGSLPVALGMLEQDAADNFGLPVLIHVRAGMAARLGAAGLLRSTSGPLITWKGNRVVIGDGFGGVDAAGDPLGAGVEQMWATGPVTVWEGAPVVPEPRQVLNRTTNQMYLLAEQPWLIAHECYAGVITVEAPA